MSKRSAGIALFGISAFLFSMRYLSVALFFGGLAEPKVWPGDELLFPVWLGFGSLGLGLVYLVWAEVEDVYSRRKKPARPAGKAE